jgi:NTP pyrophosphatase (non-canonical NTP hydrolase)
MDIYTENYMKALRLQRERCKGASAQRERDQLVEETGELLSAVAKMSKARADRHDMASEAGDVMICIAALLERHGFSKEDFQNILDEKTKKWLASEERLKDGNAHKEPVAD